MIKETHDMKAPTVNQVTQNRQKQNKNISMMKMTFWPGADCLATFLTVPW